jgi:hypothetical protein
MILGPGTSSGKFRKYQGMAGRAIIRGLDESKGEARVIMMADESDDCRDVVVYWKVLSEG